VGEDDSSDGTREICIKYAKQYPKMLRLFLHSRDNVIYFSKRPSGKFNSMYNLIKARGEFIAICEGDDYWIDPFKLQKQVEFLERHPGYNMVHSDALVIPIKNPKNHTVKEKKQFNKSHPVINFYDSLIRSRTFSPSVLYRRAPLYQFDLLKFYRVKAIGDYFMENLVLMNGSGYYFDEKLTVYRVHDGGISVEDFGIQNIYEPKNTNIKFMKILLHDHIIPDRRFAYKYIAYNYQKIMKYALDQHKYFLFLKIYPLILIYYFFFLISKKHKKETVFRIESGYLFPIKKIFRSLFRILFSRLIHIHGFHRKTITS